MKPITDWLAWIFFAAVLILTYPLLNLNRNKDDDDDN